MHITTKTQAAGRIPSSLRGAVPILLSLGILWLLRDSIEAIDANAALGAVWQTSLTQWAVAAALTLASFCAIAQYDRLIAPQIGLSLPSARAQSAGWRATAVSQVLGYGLVTGALTRWRALGRPDGVSLWDCSRLTLGVTCAFFAGWGLVTSVAILVAPPPTLGTWPVLLAMTGLAAGCLALIFLVVRPVWLPTHFPPLRLVLPVTSYALLDTLAAACIIYVFLPPDYVPFPLLYTAFLIAFGAGMMSGLPAGIGAFELSMLALLAPADPEALLCAIMAYRMIYYAVPAGIAGLSLVNVPKPQPGDSSHPRSAHSIPVGLAPYAPAEVDLIAQGPLQIRTDLARRNAALWHRATNCDIVLGNLIGADTHARFLTALVTDAKRAGRGLGFYKCTAAMAAQAQAHGFITLNFTSEALIKPKKFSTEGSCYRQLRRKLRSATKAGVTVNEIAPPYSALARIDAEWQTHCGAPRGFSMGVLSPRLLARQRLFVARQNGDPVGFITILTGPRSWTLDIMRIPGSCPDGTAHALVKAAIEAAKDAQIPTFSLAAAPFYLPDATNTASQRLINFIFMRNRHLQGLARFKSSFAPDWHPRYIAANSPLTLGYMILDLWHLIHASDRPSDTRNEQAS